LRLLLATRNEHKRRELARLLARGDAPARFELELLPAFVALPPEDGESFAQNAMLKARAAASATGKATIADDSGIEAAALGGRPGVRSARYAGEHASDEENLRKLVREVPAASMLRYRCALAYVDPGRATEQLFERSCDGRMAPAPRGSGGFGYDPVFLPDDGPGELTMAELSEEQKDAISHRGRAARALAAWLLGEPSR